MEDFVMKCNVYILVLFLLIAGCASMKTVETSNIGHGAIITDEKNNAKYGRVYIEYRSPEQLSERTKEIAQLQEWSDEKLKNELKRVPFGGEVIVNVTRMVLDDANTRHFEVFGEMNGVEIFSREGRAGLASRLTSPGDIWWNSLEVKIREKITGPFEVYVTDKLHDYRYEYTVTPAFAIHAPDAKDLKEEKAEKEVEGKKGRG